MTQAPRGDGPRWYRVWWPIARDIVSWLVGLLLLLADVTQDWQVSPSLLPVYGFLFGLPIADAFLGGKKG